MKLTTHLHLVPGLTIRGFIRPLDHIMLKYLSTGTNLTLIFSLFK
jgi:hypothetical protein